MSRIQIDGKNFRFRCTRCGSNNINEVLGDVVVYSKLEAIDENETTASNDVVNYDNCSTKRYCCADCDLTIPIPVNPSYKNENLDLYDFLVNNPEWLEPAD